MFGIRALLCDHCNHQFKAFSLRGPKSQAPRRSKHKADVFNPAPAVDLSRLNGDAVKVNGAETNGRPNEPRRVTIDLAALRLQSQTQEEVAGAIVVDQISPVRRDLRTEITRLYAQGAKDPARQLGAKSSQSSSASAPACTQCGSSDVKRRHRTLVERVAFSVTDHKAFTCRSCGESFYAKGDGEGLDPNAVAAAGAAR
jgi:hypothetical protein